jgi:hypothetical protein
VTPMLRSTPNCHRRVRMPAITVLVTPSDATAIAANATVLARFSSRRKARTIFSLMPRTSPARKPSTFRRSLISFRTDSFCTFQSRLAAKR